MSEDSHIKVLVVDDEQDVAFGIRKLLKKKFQADVVVAHSAASAREHLSATPFNAVTLDYQLTDDDGLTLLAQIRLMDSPPPVLIVTGHGDENTAVRALELGAAGYVVKDTRLSTLLEDAFDKLLKGVELARAQESIRERESEMSLILDNVPLLVARMDAAGRFLYVNAPFAGFFEMAAEEFPGRRAREVLGPVAYARIESQLAAASSNEPVSCLSEITIGNNTKIFEILLVPRSNDDGKVADFFAFAGDITEKEKSQASVRMLSSLVELMPLGVDVFRLENPEDPTSFRLVACNRAAEQIAHMPGDGEVDQSILDVFPMTDRDTLDAFASSVRTGKTVEDLYNDYLGEYIPDTDYETSLVPLSGETLAVLFKDISGRRTLERALAASERKYRELFDSLRVGVASNDPDGRMRDANPAMLEMLGYTQGEFMELTHLDITPECWWDRDAAATRKALEKGFCDAYEKEFLRKDGSTLPVEIRVCLASSNENRLEGFWALVTDISKSKRDAEVLVNLNRELAGYAHTVSHDLRGPLAAISLANTPRSWIRSRPPTIRASKKSSTR
ncbi:MAG TPA: PAS domain S-box protein [Candidatus Anoxymicrobiaceae bacterium]